MPATARNVDMSDVREGGSGFRPKRKPEGDYLAKIVKVDDHTPGENAKSREPGWVLTIQVDGDARSSYPYYLNPAKNQVWKIGAICRAVGLNVKNAKIKFDPNRLVNRKLGVALADEEYKDRQKSIIDDVFPVADIQPRDGEADYDDADEAEEVIEDEVDDTSIPDDEDEVEDDEEEPPPAPVKKRRPAPKPAPEPEPEDDDEEEEEPAPAPVKRRRAAAPPARTATTRKKAAPVVEDDEDDDLDEIDTDDLD